VLHKPDHREIHEQTGRICSSEGFRHSLILTKFLRFIVEQTLAGKQLQLKEYTIALEVLRKKSDFNPQLDAIVRIHAVRLRKAISGYYAGPGADDPLMIVIPRGSYVPVFSRKSADNSNPSPIAAAPESLPDSWPILAVLPIINYSEDPRLGVIGHVLSNDLTVELTRFSELAVVSITSSLEAAERMKSRSEIALHLGADYLIAGNILMIGTQLQITIEIYAVKDKMELWADSFKIQDDESTVFGSIANIIRKVVGIVTGHFGILYRYTLPSRSQSITKNYSYANAIYLYNQYHLKYTGESVLLAIDALKASLEKNPDNAMIAAILGGTFANLKATDFTGAFDPLEVAMTYLNRAMKLDPALPYTYKAMAWVFHLKHDKEGYLRMIGKALEINPNNVSNIGDAGFSHVCVGEYEKGIDYLLDAVQLNPYFPWYFNLAFSLYYMHFGDFEEALNYSRRINQKESLWDPLFNASILGWLKRKKEAEPLVEELLRLSPTFPVRAEEILGIILLDRKMKDLILEGLTKAGMKLNQADTTKIRRLHTGT
jgi:TolB-like protein